MIEIVSEFIIREESSGKFELVFGPGGAYGDLFASSPGFRGVTVLRDTVSPNRFLIIEAWDSQDHREQVVAESPADYHELGALFERMAESHGVLGAFRMIAEAAVRPRRKPGRKPRR